MLVTLVEHYAALVKVAHKPKISITKY